MEEREKADLMKLILHDIMFYRLSYWEARGLWQAAVSTHKTAYRSAASKLLTVAEQPGDMRAILIEVRNLLKTMKGETQDVGSDSV